jgi:hypothetical protein
MSHVTLSKARINDTPGDLQAVEDACKALGLVFCRGVTTHQWYGEWAGDYNGGNAAYREIRTEDYGKCDHVIRLPYTPHEEETFSAKPDSRPYEIGLVKMKDGTFGLVFDQWEYGIGVEQILAKVGGKDYGKLMQMISQSKVVAQVAKQPGHYVKRIDDLGGGRTKVVVGVHPTDEL